MTTKIKKGRAVKHTRGDTLRTKVRLFLDEEQTEEYFPVDGDTLRFALKHPKLKKDEQGYDEYDDPEPLILKTIPIDTCILHLEPSDTKDLGFGEYEYDIEITYADGTVDTFITAAPFELTKEVH